MAGLANFSPRVSGFTLKSYRFAGFKMCHELQVWPFFVLRFRVFHSKLLSFRVFESYGPCNYLRSKARFRMLRRRAKMVDLIEDY